MNVSFLIEICCHSPCNHDGYIQKFSCGQYKLRFDGYNISVSEFEFNKFELINVLLLLFWFWFNFGDDIDNDDDDDFTLLKIVHVESLLNCITTEPV